MRFVHQATAGSSSKRSPKKPGIQANRHHIGRTAGVRSASNNPGIRKDRLRLSVGSAASIWDAASLETAKASGAHEPETATYRCFRSNNTGGTQETATNRKATQGARGRHVDAGCKPPGTCCAARDPPSPSSAAASRRFPRDLRH